MKMSDTNKPKFRIVSIERLDTYRDGGTLAVICWGYDGLDSSGRRFEVTQDHQPNHKGLYEMWVGHKGRERSYLLEDPAEIQHVLEMVHAHHQYQTQRTEQLITRGVKVVEALNKATTLPSV